MRTFNKENYITPINKLLIRLHLKQDPMLEYRNSYHFQRAKQLYTEGLRKEAFDELRLELVDHPKNGLAHLLIAVIHQECNIPGVALEASNQAIMYLEDSTDIISLSAAYCTRGKVHRLLDEKEQWKADADKAVKLNPVNKDALSSLGEYHYYNDDYDQSDVQFKKIAELEPHNNYGFLGVGRNAVARQDYNTAVEYFRKAVRLDVMYAFSHACLAEALFLGEQVDEAIDEIVKTLELDADNQKCRDLMELVICSDHANRFVLKLKSQTIKYPTQANWYNILGWTLAGMDETEEALKSYEKAFSIEPYALLKLFSGMMWESLGQFEHAIEAYRESLNMGSNDKNERVRAIERISYCQSICGQYEESIKGLTMLIDSVDATHDDWYFNRARCFMHLGKWEEAIADFNVAISLKQNETNALFYRGLSYKMLGNEEAATADFQTILSVAQEDEFDMFAGLAQAYLGMKDEAIKRSESMYEIFITPLDLYYIVATYCRLGMRDKAFEVLKTHFERTSQHFTYLYQHDMLFALLQNDQEIMAFLALQAAADKQHGDALAASLVRPVEPSFVESKAEIPFSRQGQMLKVPCRINDLPLHFIFDTGAADVSISSVEATFMLKNGFLRSDDLSGKEYYTTADGSVAEGVKVNLRNVEFGGLKLENVKAGVVTNQQAPLLLGQSVLSRLGRLEIDNVRSLIKIN